MASVWHHQRVKKHKYTMNVNKTTDAEKNGQVWENLHVVKESKDFIFCILIQVFQI